MNTYQAVLATDGISTYVLFLYRDIQWGDFGTTIGFHAGDGLNYFNLPESEITQGVLSLEETSNIGVGYPGVYIFRVDQAEGVTVPPGKLTFLHTYSLR